MSYLEFPRLHFSGRFQASPSTVNNDPANLGQDPPPNPGWNPNGDHRFKLDQCVVTSVFDERGLVTSGEAFINAKVASSGNPSAKIVDLDPEMQMASQIFGLKITLSQPGTTNSVSGIMFRADFRDLWGRSASGGGMAAMGAVYVSQLTNVVWNVAAGSWLEKLRIASPDRLAIRLVIDGYNPTAGSSSFTFGRISGTIGPATADEPVHFAPGRRLSGPNLGTANAMIGANSVTVDIGNSLRTTAPGGALAPVTLALAVRDDDVLEAMKAGLVETVAPNPGYMVIADLDTSDVGYRNSAGVQCINLTPDQMSMVSDRPLAIVDTSNANRIILKESDDGLYVDVQDAVQRLNPGEKAMLKFTALRFGKPAPGLTIDLQRRAGPPAGLSFPASISTGADGSAEAEFIASDPGTGRAPLDGEVYGIGGPWESWGKVSRPGGSAVIQMHVYSSVTLRPIWSDIGPILTEYAHLYPAMKARIDLSDRDEVLAAAGSIVATMNLGPDHPGYMPVTRDLSEAKRRAILDWLAAGGME